MYYKRILTFMFPVLYSPNETVYFLGFFTSWIRIHLDPDPKQTLLLTPNKASYWLQARSGSGVKHFQK